jgi:MFS family permease
MGSHPAAGRVRLLPLYAAGFVTAFGAHAVAASLGGITGPEHASLLTLGALLAVYDGAEVLLKPVFGSLADRVGPRPVLLGGLVAFALASAAFVLAGSPGGVGLARLGQGAAAAAFSPAAGALVARLAPRTGHGRAFGGYGAWKGAGYTLGPLLGGVLISVGGFSLLFATLAGLAVIVGAWAAVAVPSLAPLPRTRQTVLDLGRRLTQRGFLGPTVALAATTAALSVGVGFLPVRGAAVGLGPLATGAVVSVLAAASALVQPWAGRARDAGAADGSPPSPPRSTPPQRREGQNSQNARGSDFRIRRHGVCGEEGRGHGASCVASQEVPRRGRPRADRAVGGAGASDNPNSTPISQGIPASPPPPNTSARSVHTAADRSRWVSCGLVNRPRQRGHTADGAWSSVGTSGCRAASSSSTPARSCPKARSSSPHNRNRGRRRRHRFASWRCPTPTPIIRHQ